MTSFISVTKLYPAAAQTASLFAEASWLWVKDPVDMPAQELGSSAVYFECTFHIDNSPLTKPLHIHFSADQRCILYLNGQQIARGPDSGSPDDWFYSSYRINGLTAGTHRLSAIAWWVGEGGHYSHMTVSPGFLLAAEGEIATQLTTGIANWSAQICTGIHFHTDRNLTGAHFIGPSISYHGNATPHLESSEAIEARTTHSASKHWRPQCRQGLQEADKRIGALDVPERGRLDPFRYLTPSLLPDQQEEWLAAPHVRAVSASAIDTEAALRPVDVANLQQLQHWQDGLFSGAKPPFVEATQQISVLLDFGEIVTAFPFLETSLPQGIVNKAKKEYRIEGDSVGPEQTNSEARVEVLWAESLYTDSFLKDNNLLTRKGHRDAIVNKYFEGFGDTFHPDKHSSTSCASGLWWRSGRYVLLRIYGGATGIHLHNLRFRQTHYPIQVNGSFDSDNTDINAIVAISTRGILTCAHELYMDCPSFEQLMYAGDARIQALVHRCLNEDPRLVKKSLMLFANSRLLGGGLTLSRYPCRRSQIIPSFSFIWVLMLEDFLLWHNEADFAREQLPAVRSVLSNAEGLLGSSGLLEPATGWNFIDWDKDWQGGIPRGTPNFHLNAFFIMALEAGARMERTLAPDSGHAQAWLATAARLRLTMTALFRRMDGLFADDPQHTGLSHQAQALAVLAGLVSRTQARGLLAHMDRRAPAFQHTFYFMHYWLEACAHCGYTPRSDLFAPYLELIRSGVHTPIETLEPNRSDCHGWGSHPRYHVVATLLGLRPASVNFGSLSIRPLPLLPNKATVTLPWRGQQISVQLEATADGWELEADIPIGLPATVSFNALEATLEAGHNRLLLPHAETLTAGSTVS